MRETLIEILEDLVPDVDFESCEDLTGVLDSLTILNLIGEVADQMDVEIPVKEVIPDNFKSVDSIMALIEKLK